MHAHHTSFVCFCLLLYWLTGDYWGGWVWKETERKREGKGCLCACVHVDVGESDGESEICNAL